MHENYTFLANANKISLFRRQNTIFGHSLLSSPDDKCQIPLFIFPTRLFYCFPLWLMRFCLWGWLKSWEDHTVILIESIFLHPPPPTPPKITLIIVRQYSPDQGLLSFPNTCSLEQFLLHKDHNSFKLDLFAIFLLKCYWSNSQNDSAHKIYFCRAWYLRLMIWITPGKRSNFMFDLKIT